jgi:hypothetical protein
MAFSSLSVTLRRAAAVAELVDALDLGSSGATRESSSLSTRTIYLDNDCWLLPYSLPFIQLKEVINAGFY